MAVLLLITPQGKAAVRTLGLVAQVLPDIPVKPAEWVTQSPERHRITYPLSSGSGRADLYIPAGEGRHSALMLFMGVNPAGPDDERVVNLANSIARTGVVVMIPWSERMINKVVSAEEVDDLVWGFQHMRSLEMVDGDRLGMAGFCVGASLVMVAAQDERISEDVRMVNSFGGYYDAKDLIASVAAQSRFYDGESRAWKPDALSVEVVRLHLLGTIDDETERNLLMEALNDGAIPPVGLSSEAHVVYELLNAPDLDTAHSLIEQLPSDALDTLARISPSNGIGRLSAKLLVMHDRADSLVPSDESRRLVDALGSDVDVHYTESSLFDHLDPTRPVGGVEFIKEGVKLFLHVYGIMRELP